MSEQVELLADALSPWVGAALAEVRQDAPHLMNIYRERAEAVLPALRADIARELSTDPHFLERLRRSVLDNASRPAPSQRDELASLLELRLDPKPDKEEHDQSAAA